MMKVCICVGMWGNNLTDPPSLLVWFLRVPANFFKSFKAS